MRNTRHVSNLTPKRRKSKESSQEEKRFKKKPKQKGNINMHQKNTFLHPDYKLDTGTDTGYGYGYKSGFLVRTEKNQKTGVCKRNGFGLFSKI